MSGEITHLERLVSAINEEHRKCEVAVNAALEHAMKAGELLLRAKRACPHGTWLAWLDAHFEGSRRTAQAYMRVAKKRPALESPNSQLPAHLTLDAALKAMAKPAAEEKPPSEAAAGEGAKPAEETTAAIRQELVRDPTREDGDLAAELGADEEAVAEQRCDIDRYGAQGRDFDLVAPERRPPEAFMEGRERPSPEGIMRAVDQLEKAIGHHPSGGRYPEEVVAEDLLAHFEGEGHFEGEPAWAAAGAGTFANHASELAETLDGYAQALQRLVEKHRRDEKRRRDEERRLNAQIRESASIEKEAEAFRRELEEYGDK